MPRSFEMTGPPRVLFGTGAEASFADALVAAGAERVLLIAQPHHREGAERVLKALGARGVGVFDEVRQHVPLALAEKARERARATRADWVVAHGGGSAIGFAKAVALTEPIQIGAVVTTYSGSEGTSLWGLSGPDGKRTGRDNRVRPSLVAYDPVLTLALAPALSLMSLCNALAHAIGVLWAPTSDEHASEAVAAAEQLVAGMRAVAKDPNDLDARAEALYGAYLASSSIERAPLALQHLLAHVLGGTFDTTHAAGHTALLPYTMAFNAKAVPSAMTRLAGVLGTDPPAALYDLARAHGLPHSLKMLDIQREDLPRIADKALERAYDNPRPLTRAGLLGVLDDAYHARRPSLFSRRRALKSEGPHSALAATERGAPLEDARVVLIAIHGRGAVADRITNDLEQHLPDRKGLCLLAPQALDNSWYPKGFTARLDENQPFLDSALCSLDAAWSAATAVVPPERVVVAGFSQGACLALAWARSRAHSPAALFAFSGAQLDVEGDYENLASTRVYLSKSAGDGFVPDERFERTAAALREAAAAFTARVEPGDGHGIYDADGTALRKVLATLGVG